jgi:hypothetical protein
MSRINDELELYVWDPPTVFEAYVSGTYDRGALTVSYQNVVTGTYADVLPGMTMYVDNANVMGTPTKVRVREISIGTVTLAENEIIWSDNQKITVVKFFEAWGVNPKIVTEGGVTTFYKDGVIKYTDQNRYMDPVVVMGPNHAARPGSMVWFTSEDSYDPQGALITGTAWTFEGGVPSTYDGITPGFVRYDTPGYFIASCTCNNSNGKYLTGYRHILIGEPIHDWGLSGPVEGSRDQGGYQAKLWVREYLPQLKEGALVIIRSQQHYTSGNRGQTFFVGFIVEKSIRYNWRDHVVEFSVVSMNQVMDKLDVFGASTEYSVNPQTWCQVYMQTVDKAIIAYLRWHTTLLSIVDFYQVGDTKYVQYCDLARGGAFNPLREFYKLTIQADLLCNAQGTLYAEYIQNLIPRTQRSTLVWDVLQPHMWRNDPQIIQRMMPEVSYYEAGGMAFSGSTGTWSAHLSGYPGYSPGRFGQPHDWEGIVIGFDPDPQTYLNTLVGNMYADEVNEWPEVIVPMAGCYRDWDLAPFKWMEYSLNLDFVNWSSKRMFIDRIAHTYDPQHKVILSDITFGTETWGIPGVYIPLPPEEPEDPGIPPVTPPVIDELPEGLEVVVVMTKNQVGRTSTFFTDSPEWTRCTNGLPTGGYTSFDLDSTGNGYLIVNGISTAYDGLYYCANLATGASPIWTQIWNTAAAVTAINNTWGFPPSNVVVGPDDKAYITMQGSDLTIGVGKQAYWKGVGGAFPSPAAYSLVDVPAGTGPTVNQFGCMADSTHVNCCLYHGAAGGAGVVDLISGLYRQCITDYVFAHQLVTVSENYAIYEWGYLRTWSYGAFSNTDLSVIALWTRPIVELGGHYFWTRSTDYALMIDGIVQAIPSDSGGTLGVFSASGATGGGYMCVDSYGHLAWVAYTNGAVNTKRSIGYTEDGGGTWQTKDGDWASKLGEFAGGVSAGSQMMIPDIKFVRV